ncbi:MAG: hypothetical protein FWF56_06000 [Firmicutes bacterium]|nr:hypothetical protein [Bacillota bacterium]
MGKKISDNLIRSGNEAEQKGRNGGFASGKARRARKSLKEELLTLLTAKTDGSTEKQKLSIALLEQAKQGNVKAFEIIRDTIGEKPKDVIELSGEVTSVQLDFVDKSVGYNADDPSIESDYTKVDEDSE